jgi:hypothetical protein
MIFFVGIIDFILTCILYLIIINSNYKNNIIHDFFVNHLREIINEDTNNDNIYINISNYFEELKSNIFLLIPKLLLIFLNNFFEWQILSFFSVNHFNSSYFLYIIIFTFINENFPNKFWVFISFYILVVFFLLIFNEIIIIYSFSLERNTIHEQRMRSLIDEKDYNEMERFYTETEPIEDELNNIDGNEANTQDD